MNQYSIKAYRTTISSTRGTPLPYLQLTLKDYLEIRMYHILLTVENFKRLQSFELYEVIRHL